eukprot:CAMPEP_0181192146 /NCGR_PEP_ID=MMETSP1096-20121128/13125_1 /TAXON_ID=156174 ORGANISM="Chrysochromulina ericina, Strain CCMP281" /NCGR_SAMPLE_ID=MMETSP1096 /ASSEMBLY_ACC=CAM_ASM_000453 /LENGTH=49 /DNA_ID=CAMNT_0023281517 /DNA_START=71 /DNA_END=220 /DNA_ORIENTATION=+
MTDAHPRELRTIPSVAAAPVDFLVVQHQAALHSTGKERMDRRCANALGL